MRDAFAGVDAAGDTVDHALAISRHVALSADAQVPLLEYRAGSRGPEPAAT